MVDKVVVDSGVVIKWFVVEPYSTEAHRILEAYQAGTLTLLAPALLYAAVGNIVWKKHRFQGLATADADEILTAFRLLTFVRWCTAEWPSQKSGAVRPPIEPSDVRPLTSLASG